MLVSFCLLSGGQNLFAGGDIHITAPPKTQIWLDEELQEAIGNGPGILRNVAPGNHVLKAQNGHRILVEPFHVSDGRTTEMTLYFDDQMRTGDITNRVVSVAQKPSHGDLILRSLPVHAEIFLNGNSVGAADKKIFNLSAGTHRLRFELDGKSLEKEFVLNAGERLYFKADFAGQRIETSTSGNDPGPADIIIQTILARKPARFPHRHHQQFLDCADCHHGRDTDGKRTPYVQGMSIARCVSCHNTEMENKELNSIKLAGHALCKSCHRKAAQEGHAGPISRCIGCHPRSNE